MPHVFRLTLTVAALAAGVATAQDAPTRVGPPVPITGHAGPGLDQFDAVMQGILVRYDVPGATLALARNGKLVLARG
jgi:hypothetical protein